MGLVGSLLNDTYRLEKLLGEGGMGAVYEASHLRLARRFAVKLLSSSFAETPEALARFKREAQITSAIGHPHIVEVTDFNYTQEGTPFIVMELLDGEDLGRCIRRSGPLPLGLVASIFKQASSALHAAHQMGVIHRDLKPQNIFLSRRGSLDHFVKVVDFGISKVVGSQSGLTKSHAILGTPFYMSPEQAEQDMDSVDARSDVYAMGAITHEMLTGKPPFSGDSVPALLYKVVHTDPPSIRAARRDVPKSVERVINKAMRKDRSRRFESMALFWSAFEAVLDKEGVEFTEPMEDRQSRWTARQTVADVEGMATVPHTRGSALPEPTAGALSTAPEAGAIRASRKRRWIILLAAGIVLGAGAGGFYVWRSSSGVSLPSSAVSSPRDQGAAVPPGTHPTRREPSHRLSVDELVAKGEVLAAAHIVGRRSLRAPEDTDLLARWLLLDLIGGRRGQAYGRASALEGRALSPRARATLTAVRAFERGDSLAAVREVEAQIRSPDDLEFRYLLAKSLHYGDRYTKAREKHLEILKRWPAFLPALNGVVEKLLLCDETKTARRLVERYIAAAPNERHADLLEVEVLIGERRYREALQRISAIIADEPSRAGALSRMEGDVLVLLWDVDRAIVTYDRLGPGARRDQYVAGALLHAGRTREARDLMSRAVRGFPDGTTSTRLGSLAVDASLLALETNDVELARQVAHKTSTTRPGRVEALLRGSMHFARAVTATLERRAPDYASFPIGQSSPYVVLLRARGLRGLAALTPLRAATSPDNLHVARVTSHIYHALWLERGRAAFEAGLHAEALDALDHVLRPRHYDASRGSLIRRAMLLRSGVLKAQGRAGEARAVELEVRQRLGR